jgi:Domain of unknown function (DUF4118)
MNANSDLLRRRPKDPGDGRVPVGAAVGALGALVIAGVLVPFRDHLPNADMALALVVPVLLAAIVGGRIAGAATAVVSALTFDFVFTQPYLSLRIASKDDVATFVVLLIVAMVAAEVGGRDRRAPCIGRASESRLIRYASRRDSGDYELLVLLKTRYADWSLSSVSWNWVTVAGGNAWSVSLRFTMQCRAR